MPTPDRQPMPEPIPLPDAGGEASRTRISRTEMLLIVGFWTLVAVLSAAGGVLDPRGRTPAPDFSSPAILLAFAQYYTWALLTPFIFLLAARHGLERGGWGWRLLLYAAIGIVTAVAVDVALGWLRLEVLLPEGFPRRGSGPPGMRRGGPGAGWPWVGLRRFFFLDDLLIFAGVLAAGIARDYIFRYRARLEESVRLRAEAAELHAQAARLEAQLAGARLAALRTQLDPHFLFNTLNAVSSLVERDPRGVRRMIARLSELLRYSLERSAEQEVPLADDLRFTERYLEVMRIRFQGRLEVETRIAPETGDALVPSLILQPLVENAIKHGVSRAQGTGRIEIAARLIDDRLVLSVRDNGPGPAGTTEREGVGLRNTRARLAELYGSDQRLTLRAAEGGGAVAEVELPYHTRADLRTTGEISAVPR